MYCGFLFNVYLCRRKSCRKMNRSSVKAIIFVCGRQIYSDYSFFIKNDEI